MIKVIFKIDLTLIIKALEYFLKITNKPTEHFFMNLERIGIDKCRYCKYHAGIMKSQIKQSNDILEY